MGGVRINHGTVCELINLIHGFNRCAVFQFYSQLIPWQASILGCRLKSRAARNADDEASKET